MEYSKCVKIGKSLILLDKSSKKRALHEICMPLFASHVSRQFEILEELEAPEKMRYAILQVTAGNAIW
jgi:hypothetical protein